MSDEEVPVVRVPDKDIIRAPAVSVKKKPGPKPKTETTSSPPPAVPVSKAGYERPSPPDPVLTNRREFEEVVEAGRKHQEALAKSIGGTTAAQDYVTIIFTPAQIAFMKALLATQKASIADEILVKFDSAL